MTSSNCLIDLETLCNISEETRQSYIHQKKEKKAESVIQMKFIKVFFSQTQIVILGMQSLLL